VLGHSDCGAVQGAIDHIQLGNLTAALENIRPAVSEIPDAGGCVCQDKRLRARQPRTGAAFARELLRERRKQRIKSRAATLRECVFQHYSVDATSASVSLEHSADE
jgi:carbonic anhydrase